MSKLISRRIRAGKEAEVKPFAGFKTNVFEEPDRSPPSQVQIGEEEMVPLRWEPSFDETTMRKEEVLSPLARRTLEAAERHARGIVQTAQDQAGVIIEEGRKKAEETEATAYQAGFEQGETAGKQLAEQKIEPVIRGLRSVVENLAGRQEELLQAKEEEFVKGGLLIALQLIHREIRQDPSVVLDVVRAAIRKMQRASRLTIYVSAQDFKFLEDHLELLQTLTESGATVNIEPDASVGRGGCRVVSNTGEIDATIDSMIGQLKSQVWEED
jgi:flagellar assembly protein FliH